MKNYWAILLPALVLSGCATFSETDADVPEVAVIEKIDSEWARIGGVTLTRMESALHVRGEVLRKIAGRGPIRGHIHIEAFGADARSLINLEVDYRRRSIKARSAWFSQTLNIDPTLAKQLRVAHHVWRHCG